MTFICESSSCETTANTATKVNKLYFQPCCPGLLEAVKPSETLIQSKIKQAIHFKSSRFDDKYFRTTGFK